MSYGTETSIPANTFSLSDLLAGYVSSQAGRFQDGDAVLDPGGEVSPHEAATAQTVDPRLAWDEALSALTLRRASLPAYSSFPEWKSLVAAQEPALDLAYCAGNFPQMVRNLTLLLQAELTTAPCRARPLQNPSLVEWAEQCGQKTFPHPLFAVGVLRLAHEWDRAATLLREHARQLPDEWRSAWVNEEASLAWHAGRRDEAAQIWKTKGDRGYLPTLFNLGMSALFLNKPAEARTFLTQVVARLPEENSWHHLARLYLTLAEMR